jgi:cobalt-zinc-cadmium efflux system outer membrane protein
VHPKTPSIGRLFAVAALLAVPWRAAAQEEGAWTADEAVRRALANPEVQGILDGRIRSARAEVEARTVFPTPTLGASHEQVLGDEQVGYLESTILVEQQFDLSSWRSRLRETVPHRERALRAESDEWRLDVATSVRGAFFEVRYREERLRTIDAWIDRLGQGAAAIRARQERGDAAPYDVRRVEREIETARAQRAREEALLAEAWASLGSWSPWSSPPTLTGTLTPDAPDPASETTLPALARLQHLDLALSAEAEAWGGPFWRGWTVGAGYRFAQVGPESGHGFVVSLSVPLAFWNNDLPEIERLRAEQARVGSELRLGRTLAERAEAAARQRLERALAALSQLAPAERDAELTRLAEAAYAAGEATLTELLDAYDSEAELALARVDLQWEARRAAIELDRRRGIGVP